jgi:hypothetical protein
MSGAAVTLLARSRQDWTDFALEEFDLTGRNVRIGSLDRGWRHEQDRGDHQAAKRKRGDGHWQLHPLSDPAVRREIGRQRGGSINGCEYV